MNNGCQNLFVLSAIAYKLSECLSKEELEALAASLTALGDVITSLVVDKALFEKE